MYPPALSVSVLTLTWGGIQSGDPQPGLTSVALLQVHELEIENAEMQSHALLKDNLIRQKDAVVQRFEQHRHLCDEIIQQQRQFISGELPEFPWGSRQVSCD